MFFVSSVFFFRFPFFLRASFLVPSVSSNHTLFKAAKRVALFAPNNTHNAFPKYSKLRGLEVLIKEKADACC